MELKEIKMAICPDCDGLGYKEYEAGLIRRHCFRCKGTGVYDKRDRRNDKTLREPNTRKSRKRQKREN